MSFFFTFYIFLPLIIYFFFSGFSWLFKRIYSLVLGSCMAFLLLAFSMIHLFLFFTDIQLQIEYNYWCFMHSFQLHLELYCDRFIAIMLFLVSVVFSFVVIYSIDYMFFDPYILKFLSFLFLFIFFMFVLVCNNNFLQLFLGWEGVGLCSFLLINFWFTRTNATRSAMKALLINRIGDILLLLGFSFIVFFFSYIKFFSFMVFN
jgi:NADH:ubiquinone oxidoreductase subunit 5 (subunit L)/multisubunit Na+/H+ antiporter MnhA subunit